MHSSRPGRHYLHHDTSENPVKRAGGNRSSSSKIPLTLRLLPDQLLRQYRQPLPEEARKFPHLKDLTSSVHEHQIQKREQVFWKGPHGVGGGK